MGDFEQFLFSEPNFDDHTDDEGLALEGTTEYENTELTPAAESMVFLEVISQQCESLEEYQEMVATEAVGWELLGLIENADIAMEAVKKITIQDWKKVNMDRLIGRECIRLAKATNDPNYAPYSKARENMKMRREKIFAKHLNKARANVRAAIANSRNKVSASKSSTELKKKIDNAYKVAYNGSDPNKTHKPSNVPASKVKTSK